MWRSVGAYIDLLTGVLSGINIIGHSGITRTRTIINPTAELYQVKYSIAQHATDDRRRKTALLLLLMLFLIPSVVL